MGIMLEKTVAELSLDPTKKMDPGPIGGEGKEKLWGQHPFLLQLNPPLNSAEPKL